MEKKRTLFDKPTRILTEDELKQAQVAGAGRALSGGSSTPSVSCMRLCNSRAPSGTYYKNYLAQ